MMPSGGMRQGAFRRPMPVSEGPMGAPEAGAPSGIPGDEESGETMCPNCGCEFMPGETPEEYQARAGAEGTNEEAGE